MSYLTLNRFFLTKILPWRGKRFYYSLVPWNSLNRKSTVQANASIVRTLFDLFWNSLISQHQNLVDRNNKYSWSSIDESTCRDRCSMDDETFPRNQTSRVSASVASVAQLTATAIMERGLPMLCQLQRQMEGLGGMRLLDMAGQLTTTTERGLQMIQLMNQLVFSVWFLSL